MTALRGRDEREEQRDHRRIDERLEEEKRGVALPPPDDRLRRGTHSGCLLPIEPFRDWLAECLEAARAERGKKKALALLAARCGTTPKALSRWLYGADETLVDETLVDYATTRYGTVTIGDLYGEHVAARVRPQSRRRRDEARRCASPGCSRRRGDGRFCRGHAATFARLRDELEAETEAFRARIRRPGARPTCCASGCDEPRLASERFCDYCQEAGFSEEDYE